MARSVQRAVMTAPTASVLDAVAEARRRPGIVEAATGWAREQAANVSRSPAARMAVIGSR